MNIKEFWATRKWDYVDFKESLQNLKDIISPMWKRRLENTKNTLSQLDDMLSYIKKKPYIQSPKNS